MSSFWVYGYGIDGNRLGRSENFAHLSATRNARQSMVRYMLFKRKERWHVFELEYPTFSPIPEKVITRLWQQGQGDLHFPTKAAAEAFMLLRGSL